MMIGNETYNGSVVDNESERNHKIIVRSVYKVISEISETGIPYYKDCQNMTEMGVKKPNDKMVVNRNKR